ncbi:hypothetical protein NDU88_004742 [Pleurodeles waltl]|uniref:Uncharacterized protein n=1 Tax=Pleurodeles waltl TaxID=8319 RepID=A0AAV7UGE1_PLEWA|nr:hypothetical protein NDU88_004742 [Pleurodeles waltl]
MEARCTALAVRVAKQKNRQKPKIPSAVQVRALVRKENWDPYTWDGTVPDNDDDWNWEDEVEVRVAELGGGESREGSVAGCGSLAWRCRAWRGKHLGVAARRDLAPVPWAHLIEVSGAAVPFGASIVRTADVTELGVRPGGPEPDGAD